MKALKIIAASGLVFCMSSMMYAQIDTTDIRAPRTDLLDLLPPLQVLIDSAIAHAPQMRIADASIAQSEYAVQLGKQDWTELFSVTGRYTYGQFIVNDAVGFGLDEARGGYQVFAGISMPLSFFTGRQERIGTMEADMRIQKEMKREREMAIREEVIETFNQLILLQKLISISGEARESALLQYQMAEERFREGDLSLEELSRATDMRANFASEYEKLRNDFSSMYTRLERLVGVSFSKFPN